MKHTLLLIQFLFVSVLMTAQTSTITTDDGSTISVTTTTTSSDDEHHHEHRHVHINSCCSDKDRRTYQNGKDYRMKHSGGTLNVNLGDVKIEAYNGNEIIFTSYNEDEEESERAQGLRRINGSGLNDNTGIGLSVVKDGGNVTVKEVSSNCYDLGTYTIKVPSNMKLYYNHTSTYGEDLSVANFSNELEISCNYNDVYLTNVTGPMAVKSVYGDIEAEFKVVKGTSISLHSVYGHLDVSIPKSTKANLSMKAGYGEIYSDLNVNITSTSNNDYGYGSNKVKGTINGGGIDISLTASYEDIYLRGI